MPCIAQSQPELWVCGQNMHPVWGSCRFGGLPSSKQVKTKPKSGGVGQSAWHLALQAIARLFWANPMQKPKLGQGRKAREGTGRQGKARAKK